MSAAVTTAPTKGAPVSTSWRSSRWLPLGIGLIAMSILSLNRSRISDLSLATQIYLLLTSLLLLLQTTAVIRW